MSIGAVTKASIFFALSSEAACSNDSYEINADSFEGTPKLTLCLKFLSSRRFSLFSSISSKENILLSSDVSIFFLLRYSKHCWCGPNIIVEK